MSNTSTDLLDHFSTWKQKISGVLDSSIGNDNQAFTSVHPLGGDAIERIVAFSKGGKMLRGGLVCLANGLIAGSVSDNSYPAAAAMELFQSALLIHDDIMDRDFTRRGSSSIFHQYQELAQRSYIDDFYHLGESLGICAGDIAFFLGFELIASMGSAGTGLASLFSLCARELSYVGVAQMADVLRGSASGAISADTPLGKMLDTADPEKAVLDVYRYKTGRYTFSLPMMIGATLAGAGQDEIGKLESLGEDLGVLFQLKDDEIGIFGSEAETGKPVGSDIREGKKTLFYVYLLESAAGEDRDRFLRVLGGLEVTEAAVKEIITAMDTLGVRKRVQDKAAQLAEKARATIAALEVNNPDFTKLLYQLVDYNLDRTR